MKRTAARPISLCAAMLLAWAAPAVAQDAPGPASDPASGPAPAAAPPGTIQLRVPVQSYDFRSAGPSSPAQRLRDAPLPDPSTMPHPSDSQHDAATGADTTAFGTAYSYPNPLYGTAVGENAVANSASRSAGPVQSGTGGGLVVFEFGYPPPLMPKVPGDDLTAAPPPVTLVRLAVQASDQPVLDAKSLWVVQRAVQAYGRAGLTEITIERPLDRPQCCTRFASLVRAELIRSGLGPPPRGLLPGHRIRLVLAAMPASR